MILKNGIIPAWKNQQFFILTLSNYSSLSNKSEFTYFSDSNGGRLKLYVIQEQDDKSVEVYMGIRELPYGPCGVLYTGSYVKNGKTSNGGVYAQMIQAPLFTESPAYSNDPVDGLIVNPTGTADYLIYSFDATVVGRTGGGKAKILIAKLSLEQQTKILIYQYNGTLCTGYATVQDENGYATTIDRPAIASAKGLGTYVAWIAHGKTGQILYSKIQENGEHKFTTFKQINLGSKALFGPCLIPFVMTWKGSKKVESILCCYKADKVQGGNFSIRLSYVDTSSREFTKEIVLPTPYTCNSRPLIANGVHGRLVMNKDQIKPISIENNFVMEKNYIICMWRTNKHHICWAYADILALSDGKNVEFQWSETYLLTSDDVTGNNTAGSLFRGYVVNLITENRKVYAVLEDMKGAKYSMEFDVETNQPHGIPSVTGTGDGKLYLAYRTMAHSKIAVVESLNADFTEWSAPKILPFQSTTDPTIFYNQSKHFKGSYGIAYTDIKEGYLKIQTSGDGDKWTLSKPVSGWEFQNLQTDKPVSGFVLSNDLFMCLVKKKNSTKMVLAIYDTIKATTKLIPLTAGANTSGRPTLNTLPDGRIITVYKGSPDNYIYYLFSHNIEDQNSWTGGRYNANNTSTEGPAMVVGEGGAVKVLFKGVSPIYFKLYFFVDSGKCAYLPSIPSDNTPCMTFLPIYRSPLYAFSICFHRLYMGPVNI